MKLTNIFESLLLEMRPSEIQSKYYNDIDGKVFNQIVKSDPNSKLDGSGEIKKIGKYSKLLLDLYRKGNLKLEDLPKATEYLGLAYKHNVGIPNTIGGLDDVYDLVSKYMLNDNEVDVTKLLEQLGKDDYELLYNGEKWYIFKPKNKKSACILGSGTEWCTAWGEHSTDPSKRGRDGMYDYYSKQDDLYILINKSDNSDKYQFHIKSNQYMNKADRGINMNDFLDRNEEILYFFNPKLKDLGNASDVELDELLVAPIMNSDGLGMVVDEVVKRGGNNEVLSLLLNEEYDELNKLIGDSKFVVDIANYADVTMNKFDVEELDGYRYLYRSKNDDYYDGREDSEYYLDSNSEDIFNKIKDDVIKSFNDEGLDIVHYAESVYGDFDFEFLKEHFFDDSLDSIVAEEYDRAHYNANEQAVTELIDKGNRFFDLSRDEINANIFKVFLLKSDKYDGRSFAEFLNERFDLPIGYDVHDEINELVSQYMTINDGDIIRDIINSIDSKVNDFMDENEDDIRRYHYKHSDDNETNDWYHNSNDGEISNSDYAFFKKLNAVLAKYGNNNTYFNDETKTLKIYSNKINSYKGLVYITFKDKTRNKDYNGYVTLDQLVKYIQYNGDNSNFYNKLETILHDMGVDKSKDYFENDIVKLRIDYNKVDIANDTIWIELTDKTRGNTTSGMVSIDKLPTYFTNYKLFEELTRIKKLLK